MRGKPGAAARPARACRDAALEYCGRLLSERAGVGVSARSATAPGGTVAANSLWNLAGQVVPMLAAVLCIPPLVRGLGVERFGILTLVWVVVGYFGLFDLGLGRSLTKLVAERVGTGNDEELSSLVWTALVMLALLGAVGAAVIATLAPWLAGRVLVISPPLVPETVGSLRWLAVGLPLVFLSGGLKGVLEATGRFAMANAVRIPMGVYSFVGPLIAMHYSIRLPVVTTVLVAGRVLTCAGLFGLCLVAAPALRRPPAMEARLARPLVRLGGWMTVSNIVAPFMAYMDRFIIGMVASTAVVAYYTTPYEVVSKLTIVPGALAGVLFPLFSRRHHTDPQGVAALLGKGVKYVLLTLFPATVVTVAVAPQALDLWLGPAFARNSAPVLQWLAVGMLVNAVGQIAFALVQGVGRPDLTAALHLAELPVYLVALRVMVGAGGVTGAALAWVTRVAIDTTALLGVSGRLVPAARREVRRAAGACAGCCAVLMAAMLVRGAVPRVALALSTLAIAGFVAWRWVLTPEERIWMTRPIRRRSGWSVG